jgi:hypothetical protein
MDGDQKIDEAEGRERRVLCQHAKDLRIKITQPQTTAKSEIEALLRREKREL